MSRDDAVLSESSEKSVKKTLFCKHSKPCFLNGESNYIVTSFKIHFDCVLLFKLMGKHSSSGNINLKCNFFFLNK